MVYAWADDPEGQFKGGWARVAAKVLAGGRWPGCSWLVIMVYSCVLHCVQHSRYRHRETFEQRRGSQSASACCYER